LSEDLEILSLVVRASRVKLSGERGAIILRQAARSRKTDLVRFLLDSGAYVNSRDPRQGGTPLLSAVVSGSYENARLLLTRGANPHGRDNSGRTAIWYAGASENTGLIKLLLEHGADVNAPDNAGQTALMHAADLCYTWDIRVLLDAGADPTVPDKRGRTALEPQLVSVGDPKCASAREMIADAVRSWPSRQRR